MATRKRAVDRSTQDGPLPPGPPITPKPESNDQRGGYSTTSRTFNVSSSNDKPLPIVYGQCKVAPWGIFYAKIGDGQIAGWAKNELIVAYLICHGPVESITNIRIDDKLLGNGIVGGPNGNEAGLNYVLNTDYEVFLGNNASYSNILWTAHGGGTNWPYKYPNLVYVVIKFKSPDGVGNPILDFTKFTCEIKGTQVKDARIGAGLYYEGSGGTATDNCSNNVAMALNDLLTNDAHGAGIDPTIVNSTFLQASANYQDFQLSTPTRDRYNFNFHLKDPQPLSSIVEVFRQHGQLIVTENAGEIIIDVDQARADTGILFTDQGTSANIVSASVTWKGMSDFPTRLTGQYIDIANNYKDCDVQIEDPKLATGALELIVQNYSLQGLSTYDQAMRMLTYLYNRSRLDQIINLKVTLDGLLPIAGDRVKVTSLELNCTNLDCSVVEINASDTGSTYDIILELYSAATYSDTLQSNTISIPPANPSAYDAPPEACIKDVTLSGDFPEYLTLETPFTRVSQLWPTTWTNSGMVTFTAANVNDGNTATLGFNTNTGNTTAFVSLDTTTSKRFREAVIWADKAFSNMDVVIEYSTDNVNWFAVTYRNRGTYLLSGGKYRNVLQWDDVGASKRYWRFRNLQTTTNLNIYELQFTEWQGTYLYIQGYNVYAFDSAGNQTFREFIPVQHSADVLLGTGKYMIGAQYSGGGMRAYAKILITVLSLAGVQSYGQTWERTRAIAMPIQLGNTVQPTNTQNVTITDASDNNDVVVLGDTAFAVLTGPTNYAVLTGITGGWPGRQLTLLNSFSFPLIILAESTGSSALNRFETASSEIYVTEPNTLVNLQWNGYTQRWRIVNSFSGKSDVKELSDDFAIESSVYVRYEAGGSTLVAVGPNTFTETGTKTGTNGLVTFTTPAATSGSVAKLVSAYAIGSSIDCKEMRFHGGMPDSASVRYWVGLFTADPSGTATPTNDNIGFRYDTSVDGTGYWRTYTSNGTGNTVKISTFSPVNSNAKMLIRCIIKSGALYAVQFFINDTLLSTHYAATDKLPTWSAALIPMVTVTTLTTATKSFTIRSMRNFASRY